MPVNSARFTLGTATPTQIVAPDNQPQSVLIHEADHNESTVALIGGPDVSDSNGLHIHAASTHQLELGPEDELWAISDQGAPILHVLTITNQD